jgi:Na+/proline symporter
MRLRHIFGLMLCALLCLFAIGAKTAAYRPHQEQVKNLTSAKAWQNNQLPSPQSAPVPVPILLALAMLMLMVTFTVTREASAEQPAFASRNWYDPALAVRPPPSS